MKRETRQSPSFHLSLVVDADRKMQQQNVDAKKKEKRKELGKVTALALCNHHFVVSLIEAEMVLPESYGFGRKRTLLFVGERERMERPTTNKPDWQPPIPPSESNENTSAVVVVVVLPLCLSPSKDRKNFKVNKLGEEHRSSSPTTLVPVFNGGNATDESCVCLHS